MYDILNTITAGNALFLAFLVLAVRKDTNSAANRWLAAFLILLGLFLLDDALLVYGVYEKYPHAYGIMGLPQFALAPTLYCCIVQYVSVDRKLPRQYVWHFLPAAIFVLLSLPFLLLASAEQKIETMTTNNDRFTSADIIILSLIWIHYLTYWGLSLRKLMKHRRAIENITADTEHVNLDWLRNVLYGVGAMLLVWAIELATQPLTINASWLVILYLSALLYLGYHALSQWEVFPYSAQEAEAISTLMEATEAVPVRRQNFNPEELELQKARLNALMLEEKPYLKPELNLPTLARYMHMSVHELSELVNTGFDENFSQFINRYRVEESKRLLRSEAHRHLSMLGIAYEAGFNSKTAFNTAFKKIAGCAPSVYRDQAI